MNCLKSGYDTPLAYLSSLIELKGKATTKKREILPHLSSLVILLWSYAFIILFLISMNVVIVVLYGVDTVLGLWALHEDKNIIFIMLFSAVATL